MTKKFKINFIHLVENEYEAIIEAKTKEEALKIFDEEPFEYAGDALDEQGLRITIKNVIEE